MENYKENETERRKEEPILNFNKEEVTLLLEANPTHLALNTLTKVAPEKGLSLKNEFHITLLGRETGEAILKILDSQSIEKKASVLSEIETLAKSFEWSYVVKDEYYEISKSYSTDGDQEEESRRSVIQMIDLPDLVPFYDKLNKLLDTNFLLPMPHVTLFTTSTLEKNKLRGIGLYSEDQFNSLNPERMLLSEEHQK